ncbi:MAG TPA: ribosome biogenesis GTPase YlqF [Candidatus Aphodocola excrementigallinarum]|uniref:Ribosome biogenesis GTPase A n=1 Tax=Candidatus Aphodocola excrementigallinarum TaxID=2840670 RepID=A0A9D1IPU1_9FIRM|nr:ribosome biogenesis GTPase YlqF [Candidatus Aphodocola excrementigallinarum]
MNEEKGFNKTVINWYPGHMAKTKRLINENIDKVDIIYEVIDARIPLSSKIKDSDIENLINKKPRILIMTKSDLCDLSKTNLWVKYYENVGYKVVLVDLINNKGVSKILDVTNLLLKDIDEKREAKGLNKRRYRALIIGIPNVGKSTLINRLVGKKAAVTGNKPGVTKSLSWIRINNNVDLLDSPGILWPKLENEEESYNLASFSAIKEEILPKGKVACYILDTMYKKYKDNLKERYGIDAFDIDDVIPTYDIIGKKRGCLIKGGEVDYDKVSNLIINDLKEGRLGKVTFDEVK